MYDELFESMFEIVTFFNRPKNDKSILNRSGVTLDTALFPILVRVGMQNGIGIVELSAQLGRDHSTVSRQVDKLQSTGLVVSDAAKSDARVREIRLSRKGRLVLSKIAKARRDVMRIVLGDWDDVAIDELKRNLRRLANSLSRQF